MANDALTQQTLAQDHHFRTRVKSAMAAIAWQVINEDPSTPNHANREAYANQVLRQTDSEVVAVCPGFVQRPNVMNFETSYVFDFATQSGHVATAAGDPDLLSQLNSDWNDLAAAAGFPSA